MSIQYVFYYLSNETAVIEIGLPNTMKYAGRPETTNRTWCH